MRSRDHQILEIQNEKLRAILETMEKPIARIDLNVQQFLAHVEGTSPRSGVNRADPNLSSVEKRRKILDWVSTTEYEKHHQQANENMLDNTGRWLLDEPRFCARQCSSASGIPWLHGIRKLFLAPTLLTVVLMCHKAGAGKTKLTYDIYPLLVLYSCLTVYRRTVINTLRSHDWRYGPGLFFYYDRDDQQRRDQPSSCEHL